MKENYALTPKTLRRAAPTLFEPKQFQTARIANTSTAHGAGIHSNVELNKFLESSFFHETWYYTKAFGESFFIFDFSATSTNFWLFFFQIPPEIGLILTKF